MATTAKSRNGASATVSAQVYDVPVLQIATFHIELVGTSPLIMHRWSEKARKAILDKQQKKAQKAKEVRDPEAEYHESYYQFGDNATDPRDSKRGKWDGKSYGFPVVAFKAAAVSAVTFLDRSVTKVATRGLFHINGELTKIDGKPFMREDMVRIGMGSADLRYRAEFPEWKTRLAVRYNSSVTNPGQIANLFNIAGFAVGVGEWRPEKDGSNGMFEIGGSDAD